MILKYLSKEKWIYIDGITRIETSRLIKQNPEQQFVTLEFRSNEEPYVLEFDVTRDENMYTIFLLNDKGETIERIN